MWHIRLAADSLKESYSNCEKFCHTPTYELGRDEQMAKVK